MFPWRFNYYLFNKMNKEDPFARTLSLSNQKYESKDKKKRLPLDKIQPLLAFVAKWRHESPRQVLSSKIIQRLARTGGIKLDASPISPKKPTKIPLRFLELLALPEMTTEKAEKIIKTYLDLDDLENNVELFEQSLKIAKEFLEKWLLVTLPPELQNLHFQSKEDVLAAFRKTTLIAAADIDSGKKTKNILNTDSIWYCALAKLMAAAILVEKEGFQQLVKETDYFAQELLKFKCLDDLEEFCPIDEDLDYSKTRDYYRRIYISTPRNAEKPVIETRMYSRGKDLFSVMAKLLIKALNVSSDVVRDALGIKFEVETAKDLQMLTKLLLGKLVIDFNVRQFTLENFNLLSSKDFEKLTEETKRLINNLSAQFSERIEFIFKGKQFDKNEMSSLQFTAFKISDFKVSVPVGGDKENMEQERYGEIQIVLFDNKNEKRFCNHFIYDAKKKIVVFAELFGLIPDSYLDLITAEAHENTKLSKESIKEHLIGTLLSKISLPKYKGEPLYGLNDLTKRFLALGLYPRDLTKYLPSSLRQEIESIGKSE